MRGIRILLLSLLTLVVACERESTTPSASATKLPSDDVIFGLHHVMTKNGVKTAVLDGDTAYVRDQGQRFDVVGVNLKFFTETGQESGTLTSKTGEYDVRNNSFIARDDVVLVTQGPKGTRRLQTEELYYELRTDQVWSDKPFVLVEGGQTTRGKSFRSDAKASSWTAQGLKTEGVQAGGSGITF